MKYILHGNPVPLARARHGVGRVYDSQKDIKFAYGIALRSQNRSGYLYTGPLGLNITFYLPIPKSREKQSLQGQPHIYTPDLSNLIKLIEDCANGILYKDDCAIAEINAKKCYDNSPRTEFTIVEMQ